MIKKRSGSSFVSYVQGAASMKYHTLSSSSVAAEAKKSSTYTFYTSPDFIRNTMDAKDPLYLRCELEMAQRALKLQTNRCRQLVSEFTRKLQAKELQVLSERRLREEQLTKLIRSLLVFEARLKQEQTFIRYQLEEKDDVIQRQNKELGRLRLTMQYCKACSQFYTAADSSCDSGSSEYYQYSENGSDLYSSISERSGDEAPKITYEKNKQNKLHDGSKPYKKYSGQRRTTGTYFEVLKMHEITDSSVEDEQNESEKNIDQIENTSDQIEELYGREDTFSERMDNLHGIKRFDEAEPETESTKSRLITDTITVFDSGVEGEQNDNWYASASDPEDQDQRDLYRNNPVLECMNQILLQTIHSPPKSPDLERSPKQKSKQKSQKRVKFCDQNKSQSNTQLDKEEEDYYETPIQAGGNNVYEVPQSIYSNDYEQILSKCSDSSHNYSTPIGSKVENVQENQINRMSNQKLSLIKSFEEFDNKSQHYYIDMDTGNSTPEHNIKNKKTPPALPPKPANLLSKFKAQTNQKSNQNIEEYNFDSEPDYCSISELNLPTENLIISPSKTLPESKSTELLNNISLYDPVTVSKNSLQAPKQPQIKTEMVANIAQITKLKTKPEPEIPKLPQVSEIIIPEENEGEKDRKNLDHITQDNYIKNNSQIFKHKGHDRIVMGTSVSSLVSSFNNQHLLNAQKLSNKTRTKQPKSVSIKSNDTQPSFEKFDLSQNFEEFNLDDCEIGEDFQSEISSNQNESDTKTNSSVEIVRVKKDIHPLNIENLQSGQCNLTPQRPDNNLVPTTEPSYEHFLECTGLSSKSILTPSRIISNHKAMLKPKDIKLRSRVKSTSVYEWPNSGTVKYWSEPYL